MANKVLWDAEYVDEGDLDSGGDLESKADNTITVMATSYDNGTNLMRWGVVELELGSITPTAPAYMIVHLLRRLDGTNYEDTPDVGSSHRVVGSMFLTTTASAKRVACEAFPLPPTEFKIAIENQSNVTLAASANACNLYTASEEIQ